jgi:hypothetical protein
MNTDNYCLLYKFDHGAKVKEKKTSYVIKLFSIFSEILSIKLKCIFFGLGHYPIEIPDDDNTQPHAEKSSVYATAYKICV